MLRVVVGFLLFVMEGVVGVDFGYVDFVEEDVFDDVDIDVGVE